eukprot:3730110-Amphidinium_carterae.1
MHQANLGRFLGPRGSAASRHEQEVQNHRDMAERQELYDSALFRACRDGEWEKLNKIATHIVPVGWKSGMDIAKELTGIASTAEAVPVDADAKTVPGHPVDADAETFS